MVEKGRDEEREKKNERQGTFRRVKIVIDDIESELSTRLFRSPDMVG